MGAKPPSPLTPSSTRRDSMKPEMLRSTPSWSLPLPLMLLLCSTLLLTPELPWESTSETTACTLSSSLTTCPSRLWPTDRCLSCSDVHQVVRLEVTSLGFNKISQPRLCCYPIEELIPNSTLDKSSLTHIIKKLYFTPKK